MEDGKQSVFNAGVAMTERIDELQRTINSARFNMTSFNQEAGKFNYELMISANDGLLAESWSKLKEEERIKADKIKNIVHNFVKLNPIIIFKKGEYVTHNANLQKFEELITLYERTNKVLLDSHNLNAPNRDDYDEL